MNNQCTFTGCINSEPVFDYEAFGESFYKFILKIERTSGIYDELPVIISSRLIDINKKHKGERVGIKGQLRSYNMGKKVILFIFTDFIEILNYQSDVNDIYLEGRITRPPTYRLTPLGREISDVMLAVNRTYNKTDFIPCIMWGRSAKYVYNMGVNTIIRVGGRFQSRKYNKKEEIKTAYEVSVNLVEQCY